MSDDAKEKMKQLLEEAIAGKELSSSSPISILSMKDLINIARAEGLLRGLLMSLRHLLHAVSNGEVPADEAYKKLSKVLNESVDLLHDVNKKSRQEKTHGKI